MINTTLSLRGRLAVAATLIAAFALLAPAVGEELVHLTDGRRPYDLVVIDDDLYWRYEGSEFCDPSDSRTWPQILHFTRGEGPSVLLENDCNWLFPGRLAADESWVYFANYEDGGDDGIWRIPRAGGDPEMLGAADFVRTPNPPLHGEVPAPGNFAQDERFLYFGDWGGIRRMDKATGAVTALVPGRTYVRVAVDETAIYWTKGGVNDGIWRASKSNGSRIVRLVADDESEDPWDLTVDDTRVYWSEHGGLLRSRPKDDPAAPIADYGIRGDAVPGEVEFDDTYVYWVDELRLRRAYKDNSTAPVQALAADLRGPIGLERANDGIYWGGRALTADTYQDGIWREPYDSAGQVPVDFGLTALEVTQAIQNLANGVPLVERKITYARAYAESDLLYDGVTARLTAHRGGETLGTVEPLAPVRLPAGAVDRARYEQSFNFLLPEDWRSGEVRLVAEVNPEGVQGEVLESDRTNNSADVTVTFEHRDNLCVTMVPIFTSPGGFPMGDPRYFEAVSDFEAAYPVPEAQVYWDPWAMGLPYYRDPWVLDDDTDRDDLEQFSSEVLVVLNRLDMRTLDLPGCSEGSTHFYGMGNPYLFEPLLRRLTTRCVMGQGYMPGRQAWGTMNVSLDCKREWAILSTPNVGTVNLMMAFDWTWYPPPAWSVMAEEIGHNLGREHVDCGPDGMTYLGFYPYPPCDLGPDTPEDFFGFHPLHQAVIPPTEAADFMSYAALGISDVIQVTPNITAQNVPKPEWVSYYTTTEIAANVEGGPGEVGPGMGLAAPAPPEPRSVPMLTASRELLAVGGVLHAAGDKAELLSVERLDRNMLPSGAAAAARAVLVQDGRYALKLLNGGGDTLAELRFEPAATDGPMEWRPFFVIMPYPTGRSEATELLLEKSGQKIAQRAVSPSPPEVQVLRPNGGETITRSLTVEWRGGDPDGDPLDYLVEYSPDGGATWQVLVLSTPQTKVDFHDLTGLAGGAKALVRVTANDGFHTASDISDDPFRVATKAPVARILRPREGEVVPLGTRPVALGRADDPEQGQLPSSALAWNLDGEGAGSGRSLALRRLPPGEHTLRLEAVDSGGAVGSSEVTFFVRGALCEREPEIDLAFLLETGQNGLGPTARREACNMVASLVADLRNDGAAVRHRVFATAEPEACALKPLAGKKRGTGAWASSVANAAENLDWNEGSARVIISFSEHAPAVPGAADEGPAVTAAENLDWKQGAARVIGPFSKHAPAVPGAADAGPAVTAAVEAARRHRIAVFPWFLGKEREPGVAPAGRRTAELVARATGGRLVGGDESEPAAALLARVVADAGCEPLLKGVEPACGFKRGAVLRLRGSDLVPGVKIYVGGRPALDVRYSADGRRMDFRLPHGLLDGEMIDIRAERPDGKSDTLVAAVLNGPCEERSGGGRVGQGAGAHHRGLTTPGATDDGPR